MTTAEFQSLVIDWLTFNTVLLLFIVVVGIVEFIRRTHGKNQAK